MDAAQAVQSLTSSLSREQNYVLMMRPNAAAPNPVNTDELRLQHHDYLVDLERAGRLFAAGPFADRNERPVGAGMIIIRADSLAEAQEIGAREPFTKAGLRTMDVMPWQRNEGSLRIELRLADGVLTIDGRTYDVTKPR